MHAAMDIGVIRLGETGHRVQDLTGLLGRSAAVEIDQRFAIDLARQNGKIGADLLHVEGRRDLGGRGHADTRFRAALTAPRTASLRSILAMSVSASSRNA